MTATQIVQQLESLGHESLRRTMAAHGAPPRYLGVKIEDLKKIQKKIKVDHDLALALWDTGVPDARYLAGLVADDPRMSRGDLRRWVEQADWSMLSEYTVPWVAAGSPHGHDLAREWIEDARERVAAAGWATFAGLAVTRPDAELDLAELRGLLARVPSSLHEAPNRVRYVMNGFVIALGCAVAPLADEALAAAEGIGRVSVDMGGTACKVPFAPDYIRKVHARGGLGRKRKSAKC